METQNKEKWIDLTADSYQVSQSDPSQMYANSYEEWVSQEVYPEERIISYEEWLKSLLLKELQQEPSFEQPLESDWRRPCATEHQTDREASLEIILECAQRGEQNGELQPASQSEPACIGLGIHGLNEGVYPEMFAISYEEWVEGEQGGEQVQTPSPSQRILGSSFLETRRFSESSY